MKICFVTNGVITRHATMKRAFQMAPLLLERGHHVTVIAVDAPENISAASAISHLELLVYREGGSALAMRAVKEKLVAAGRYDVVHICGLGWRNALRPRRLDCTITIMDHVEIESTLVDTSQLRRWLQRRLEAWSLGAYDAHIGASRYLEAWLRHRLFQSGIVKPLLWLSYANDYQGDTPAPEVLRAIRQRFGERKLLLYFGNFYRQYGFWELLKSVKELSSRRDDFTLLLAGRGPEQPAGEAFIQKHALTQHAVFTGYLAGPEALGHLRAAHACLVPLFDTETDWARSPGKLFNSMNAGRPVITAPVGEANDCFSTREFFYNPTVAGSMTPAIDRALDTGADWTPNYQIESHSWDMRTAKWVAWVERLLVEHRPT